MYASIEYSALSEGFPSFWFLPKLNRVNWSYKHVLEVTVGWESDVKRLVDRVMSRFVHSLSEI